MVMMTFNVDILDRTNERIMLTKQMARTRLTIEGRQLDRVGELARQAGADLAEDLGAIRSFLAGPAVITVAAESADYGAGVVALVESGGLGADVRPTSLRDVPQPALRDLLVVVTSADRALSRSEEEVVRAAYAHGGPVVLAVVEAALFGDGPARKQAITEIERLRLGPALTPLAVPWFFVGTPEGDEAFAAAVRRASSAGHERAARRVLDAVVRSALDVLAPRLAARDREAAQLRNAEVEFAAVPRRLEHEAGLVRLTVRKSLGDAEQDVYQTGLETAARAATWLAGDRRGDWAAVEVPVRQSWLRCLDLARHIVDQLRARFAAEIARLDPTASLGPPPSELGVLSASWDTGELGEALQALTAIDLDKILGDFRAELEPEPEEPQEDAESGESGEPAEEPAEPSLFEWITDHARQLTLGMRPDGLRAHLNAELNVALAGRMAVVAAAAEAATTAGTRADTDAGLAVFADRLSARRAEFDEAGRWTAAYAELAGLAGGPGAGPRPGPGHADGS
jgi:hypothetical protein